MSLISYLTRIHFGDGILETALTGERDELGIKCPLVITDRGVSAAGLLDGVLASFKGTVTVTVFYDTPQNPTEQACRAAVQCYRENDCDGIVALGGGSSIDLAKATALTASHGGDLETYTAISGGVGLIRDILPPLIAIPTTAGTGSEVGRGALIVLDDNRKLGILSPFLLPKAAICDPTLTMSLPPFLTAATGMDALAHCVETYISTAFNPPADGIALEGLRRAAANVARATRNGGDLVARREMMAAAMNGALAFQKGLGAVHAMSHALGGLPSHQLHHGVLNAILLPAVLRFNAPVVGERYAALNAAMGLAKDADIAAKIFNLVGELGLPTKLSQIGVTRQDIERAAPWSEKDHTNTTNPRKASAADYREMLEQAF